jgi:hypothetical protein
MRYSAKGEKLWKRAEARVILLPIEKDGKVFRPKGKHYRGKPARGCMYTENDILLVLEQVTEDVEKSYPGREFEIVELAPNIFNIVERQKEPKANGEVSDK